MEPVPEEQTPETHAMIADMELESDSPPMATEPDTKRVKTIESPAVDNTLVTANREQMIELRPSLTTSSKIPPGDAVARRLRTLEVETINQHTKHEELKSTAQQLVTDFGTAIRRLEEIPYNTTDESLVAIKLWIRSNSYRNRLNCQLMHFDKTINRLPNPLID